MGWEETGFERFLEAPFYCRLLHHIQISQFACSSERMVLSADFLGDGLQ